jgi:hypothetical protein
MKKLFLFLSVISLALGSCSKSDDSKTTTTSCFSDTYNGTYVGTDGNFPQEPNVTVKLTKTGCETCTLESTLLGNKSVGSLSASAGGGFAGKLSDGSAVSISLSGNQIAITCSDYAYGGTKQ